MWYNAKMHYVYVLVSNVSEKIYVGFTNDLKKRLHDHNYSDGKSYTSKFRPWILVYYEAYLSGKDARIREQKLKHRGRAKILLRQRLQYSLRNSKGAQ